MSIGFLFPGQGAQVVGMGLKLVERSSAAKALFNRANDILGFDLAKVCFEGPKEQLDTTEISQPAIFVHSLAALECLRAESPQVVEGCAIAAGLSLGEYTALVFSGAMSFEDGLKVVQRRGQAMQAAANATPSGMVSILMLDRDKIEALCQEASSAGLIKIANLLCPGNIVVSGDKAACQKVMELAEAAGGRTVALQVAGAFHTQIMQPADAQLGEALNKTTVNAPRIPVISNVDATSHTDPAEIRSILVRQVISPVLWEDCVRKMLASGVDKFYEIGPGSVLKGLLKRIDRKIECVSVNDG